MNVKWSSKHAHWQLVLQVSKPVVNVYHCYTTRHKASTRMYSLTFCVHIMPPERHQWKPAMQAAAVMLRTPPCRWPVTGQPATSTSHIRRAILRTPPSLASHRPAARAHPAERSHYLIISRDGRKLVTRIRVMLP